MRQKYEVIARYGFTKARYKGHPASRLDVRATRIFNVLKMVGCIPKSGGVLDVGGAWGYNLAPFRGVARLFLIDPEKWRQMGADITWLGAGIGDTPPSMSFDLILFLHTLEHVTSPFASLMAIASRLTASGALYVEVPLGLFRETNNLREPITHLNFFGERSLATLLRRCGLRVVHLSTRHQWVTTGAQWCVNAVGVREQNSLERSVRAWPDWFQKHNPYYYVRAAIGRLTR